MSDAKFPSAERPLESIPWAEVPRPKLRRAKLQTKNWEPSCGVSKYEASIYGLWDTHPISLLLYKEQYKPLCVLPLRAPADCRQYFTGVSGTVKSYNFGGAGMLPSQLYTNCFRQEQGN